LIKQSRPLLPLVCASWLFAGAAMAQSDSLSAESGQPRTRDQARHLREEATAIRQAGEIRHGAAQKTCWDKFLVSACLADAAKSLRDEKSRAYALEKEAREIERDIRKREFAEREAKRLERANTPPDVR
jgi:colicin import membrane protein